MRGAFVRAKGALIAAAAFALVFGCAEMIAGRLLIDKAEALYGFDEEKRLQAIAQDYSRRLLSSASAGLERVRLESESALIARRGAFLTAYGRYRRDLALRWAIEAAVIAAALAMGAFWVASAYGRERERASLRREAERARSQWQTTGRVLAHEIKNALSPMSLDIGFLASSSLGERTSAEQACLERMGKNIRRVTSMVNSFREFSELPAPSFRVFRLGATLEAAAEQAALSELLAPSQLQALSLRKLYSDPEYLEIVFVNILKNASEAGASRIDARWSRSVLTLIDDGPGIPPVVAEILEREGPRPGLTTKANGNGMGLYIIFELCKIVGIEARVSNAAHGLEIKLVFRHE
jgi:Signal transduction histidine kinase involved in nitrogen fixation and metabolism regulation